MADRDPDFINRAVNASAPGAYDAAKVYALVAIAIELRRLNEREESER